MSVHIAAGRPRSAVPAARNLSTVSTRRAAWELGLAPREMDSAVRLDHIPTVGCAVPWQRRVARAELDRLRADRGFTTALRERGLLVNATRGAELLAVSPARFARLARGGLLVPVDFRLGSHRVVIWRYAAAELREFAGRSPQLLTGALPVELREALRRGVDLRPRRWRRRRTDLLAAQAGDPWQRAAVPAAVLEPPVLQAEVPDAGERAVLHRLRPPLTDSGTAGAPADQLAAVLKAECPGESRRYRADLAHALAAARSAGPPAGG